MDKIFKYQIWHILAFVILALAANYIFLIQAIPEGEFLGLNTQQWFWISLLVPLIHQVYVCICWRSELFYKKLTNIFGEKAFTYYAIGFAALFLSRFLFYITLGISDWQSMELPINTHLFLIFLFLIPSIYLIYCVIRYFGIKRAFGIDHFEPGIYKNKPLVKEGIYKYTSNAMYKYVFLMFYVIAVVCGSKATLISVIFSHLFIWAHYYCTEKPDMDYIYKN